LEGTQEIKQKILDRSDILFRKYGIKSVTMDDIAKDLGMSKKTIYQYINNKNDLLSQIMVKYLKEETETMDNIQSQTSDAIEEMVLITQHVLKKLRSFPPTTMYDLQKYYREIWTLMQNFHQKNIYNCIHKNIEKGIKKGLYQKDIDIDIITKFYVGKVLIVADEDMFPLKKYDKEKLLKQYMLYHIRGIATEKGLKKLEKHIKNLL